MSQSNQYSLSEPSPDKDYTTCRNCGGMGWLEVACPECDGRGDVEGQTCQTCWGHRRVQEKCPYCDKGRVPRW
jgi:hypothetical protein